MPNQWVGFNGSPGGLADLFLVVDMFFQLHQQSTQDSPRQTFCQQLGMSIIDGKTPFDQGGFAFVLCQSESQQVQVQRELCAAGSLTGNYFFFHSNDSIVIFSLQSAWPFKRYTIIFWACLSNRNHELMQVGTPADLDHGRCAVYHMNFSDMICWFLVFLDQDQSEHDWWQACHIFPARHDAIYVSVVFLFQVHGQDRSHHHAWQASKDLFLP